MSFHLLLINWLNNSLVDKASNSDFITVTGTTGSQINVESQIPYPAGVSAKTHCVIGFSCQYSNNNYYSATGLVSVSGNPDCIIVNVSATGYCNKPIKEAGHILLVCDKFNKNGKRAKHFGHYWKKL